MEQKRIHFLDKPVIVEIFPTLDCNVHCTYCDRGEESSELTHISDCALFFEALKKDPRFRLERFRVSGREPLLYPQINQLIAFLHGLAPDKPLEVFSNGLAIENLDDRSLEKIILAISVYSYTKAKLANHTRFRELLRLRSYKIIPIEVTHHELLVDPGTVPNEMNPFSYCFSPTLLCGTRNVYPCCRAHLFEQMHTRNYHYTLDTADLYEKLIALIEGSDLCAHCPRMYADNTVLACAQGKCQDSVTAR